MYHEVTCKKLLILDKEQRNVIEKTESNPLFLKFLLNKILLHKHARRSQTTNFHHTIIGLFMNILTIFY